MITLEIEAGCGVRVDGETGEKRVGKRILGELIKVGMGLRKQCPHQAVMRGNEARCVSSKVEINANERKL